MFRFIVLILLLTGCAVDREVKTCELSSDRSKWICSTPTKVARGFRLAPPTAAKVGCWQAGGFSWTCQHPAGLE